MEEKKVTTEDLVEVTLANDEDFLKVKETLTRMGVSSRKDKKLYQSCHILHKRGKYYIVHFKELFGLDGLPNNMSENDMARRNTIVNLLEEWELVEIVDINKCNEPVASIGQIKIISHKDKCDWDLIPKYHIGNKR
tara:strand:+ start:890 stop:1297 length:408 start_codon:yes stop_codon:yes gene_type:complete